MEKKVRNTIIDFKSLKASLDKDEGRKQESVQGAAQEVAPGDALEQARLIAAYNNAMGRLEEEDKGTAMMSSSENALASRIQSYLVERALEEGGDTDFAPAPGATNEVKFDSLDVFPWIGTGLRRLFRSGKFDFRDPDPVAAPIADQFPLAMFSDWGTGLYGAPEISTSIENAAGGFGLVMHLGDTYYSGTQREIDERLVETFPKVDGAIRRALNGNHEMYSSGRPYIEAVDREFGQKSSCFAYQNTHWLLACLDSAYVDHSMSDGQVAWLDGLIRAAGSRKVILFSHHQPFSQLDNQGPKLVRQLKDILDSGRIHAWFWGHEHRCVIYDPHPDWGFKGRCVGHGGFPEFRDKFDNQAQHLEWRILPQKEENGIVAPRCRVLDGPNTSIPGEEERYIPHGFVTLEFDGAQCLETYKLPSGIALAAKEVL